MGLCYVTLLYSDWNKVIKLNALTSEEGHVCGGAGVFVPDPYCASLTCSQSL